MVKVFDGSIEPLSREDDEILKMAVNIINEAEKQKIVLRILGAIAIFLHGGEFANLYKKLGRLPDRKNLFTDIDLIGYSSQRLKIREFFEDFLKFSPDLHVLLISEGKRLIYHPPGKSFHIDVFFDTLSFSHDVPFGKKPGKGRLELDFPTVTPTDLLLEKLQIHEINEKDLIDLIVLLRSHEYSDQDEKDKINSKYIARLLADDWGFWFDATSNLRKLSKYVENCYKNRIIQMQDKEDVLQKVNQLLKIIEEEPKTKKWKRRAKIGTSKPWFRTVEEIIR